MKKNNGLQTLSTHIQIHIRNPPKFNVKPKTSHIKPGAIAVNESFSISVNATQYHTTCAGRNTF